MLNSMLTLPNHYPPNVIDGSYVTAVSVSRVSILCTLIQSKVLSREVYNLEHTNNFPSKNTIAIISQTYKGPIFTMNESINYIINEGHLICFSYLQV